MKTETPFAIIEKNGIVTRYEGTLHQFQTLSELQTFYQKRIENTLIFLNPFCTIRERGFETHGNEPILAIDVGSRQEYTRAEIMTLLSEKQIMIKNPIIPSLDNEEYAHLVDEIKEKEIRGGNICQMILSQSYTGKVESFSPEDVASAYKNLLKQRGQYMTMLFSDGKGQSFISATPEQHLAITGETIVMNPIAGTIRKLDPTDNRPLKVRLLEFLKDPKEIQELYHVLDEELKMMEVLCSEGGRIEGPFLRQNGAVIHTEYRLIGCRNSQEMLDSFRHTLHAPTLVGGPEKSAASIIYQYEPGSREYYGGEIGILENDTLDTAILIRMAHFQLDGTFTIRAGAGITNDSIGLKEAEEVRLKTAGMQAALLGNTRETDDVSDILSDPEILTALSERNKDLSSFHFLDQSEANLIVPELQGKTAIVIHNDDDFSYILGRMMRQMGMEVEVVKNEEYSSRENDMLVIGGGPGDINDTEDPRMNRLKKILQERGTTPVLGICLGCQAICQSLNIPVGKIEKPLQGVQRTIQIDGKTEKVGHYNSFAGLLYTALDYLFSYSLYYASIGKRVPERITSRNSHSSIIDSVFSPDDHLLGVQFHPESVMTQNGSEILKNLLLKLLKKI